MELLKLLILLLIGALLFLLIGGCSIRVKEYRQEQPQLLLEEFFNGQLVAYGMVQNHSGKVIRRFKADIVGRWEGASGTLDERFEFSDGEVQTRCWRLEKTGTHYRGTAEDIVGEAVGEVQGNALHWNYILRIPVGAKQMNIRLDDWLFLIDEHNLINRTQMKKFGLPVGSLTLHIRKLKAGEIKAENQQWSACSGASLI